MGIAVGQTQKGCYAVGGERRSPKPPVQSPAVLVVKQ